jgi:hypothetical protein
MREGEMGGWGDREKRARRCGDAERIINSTLNTPHFTLPKTPHSTLHTF